MVQGVQIHGKLSLKATHLLRPLNLQPLARVQGAQFDILSEPALIFLAALHRTFNATRLSVRESHLRL
jgi:hypothetical protein